MIFIILEFIAWFYSCGYLYFLAGLTYFINKKWNKLFLDTYDKYLEIAVEKRLAALEVLYDWALWRLSIIDIIFEDYHYTHISPYRSYFFIQELFSVPNMVI